MSDVLQVLTLAQAFGCETFLETKIVRVRIDGNSYLLPVVSLLRASLEIT